MIDVDDSETEPGRFSILRIKPNGACGHGRLRYETLEDAERAALERFPDSTLRVSEDVPNPAGPPRSRHVSERAPGGVWVRHET